MARAWRSWTDPEKELLKEHFPTLGASKSVELFKQHGYDRCVGSIQTKADALGLVYEQSPIWTDPEKEIVRRCFSTMGSKATAEELARHGYIRTTKAVGAVAKTLGYRRQRKATDVTADLRPSNAAKPMPPMLTSRLAVLIPMIERAHRLTKRNAMQMADGRTPGLPDLVSIALETCNRDPDVLDEIVLVIGRAA